MIQTFFKNLLGTASLTVAAVVFALAVLLVLLPASVPFLVLGALAYKLGFPFIGGAVALVLTVNGWVTAVERNPGKFQWVYSKLKFVYEWTVRFAIRRFWT